MTESPAFYANAKQQLDEAIHQRHSHPSIVCWSVFNEITSPGPSPTNLIHQLVELEAQKDPGRPSTAASNAGTENPANFYTDLIAFSVSLM